MRPNALLCGLLPLVCLVMAACETTSPHALRQAGEKAYDRADYEVAREKFERYNEVRPGRKNVHVKLGQTYMELGRPAKAREQFWIAYSADVNDDDVFEKLAASLLANGQNEELYRLLRQRVTEQARVSDHLRLARYAVDLGDMDEAQLALRTAAQLDRGKTIEPQLALADFYEQLGDADRALDRLRMAYFIEPGNAEVDRRIREKGHTPGPTFALAPAER